MEGETRQCPQCKETIMKDAKKCKHCGADLRNWFARHKIVTGLLVLFAVGIVMSSTAKSKPTSTQPPIAKSVETTTSESQKAEKEQPTAVPTEAPLKVSVKEIGDDFESNQVAAESKWGGKLVEFKAEISNITDSGISFHNVTSKEFSFAQISCDIVDRDQLLTLKKGQMVTVRGVVGKQTLGVIDVNECQVVQ